MGLLARTLLAVTVVVVPGAFVLFLAYAAVRAIRQGWIEAAAHSDGGRVTMRSVLAQLSLKDIVREARAVAF